MSEMTIFDHLKTHLDIDIQTLERATPLFLQKMKEYLANPDKLRLRELCSEVATLRKDLAKIDELLHRLEEK